MDYNIDMHLPQRIENFFQGLETGNMEMVEISFENIKQLEDKEFNEKIKILEDEYEHDVENIEDDCFKQIKDNGRVKNYDEMMKTLDVCENNVKERYMQYFNDIKRFLIKWNKRKINI